MIKIIKDTERGTANRGWLQAKHSFSFGQYYNPYAMGVGPLVVINEDRIAPSKGFGTHAHDNMEIITYVLSGALAHKDSMGHASTIKPGNVQRMSAGTGVTHSEYNASDTDEVHLLQIWLSPDKMNIQPGYEEKQFDQRMTAGKLQLIASPDGKEGSVTIHQQAYVYIGNADHEHSFSDYPLQLNRQVYLHVIKGEIIINEKKLETGDAIHLTQNETLTFTPITKVEVLLFDLPQHD